MTKGERRKARKAARATGKPLTGELALEQVDHVRATAPEFSDTPKGRRALDHWARRYEARNGAPEGDWD